ncbi:hypothetical protein ACTD5D_40405 [Nocardia takedensis]|uniref:hypothetical protein n=1 Tax=Nocardia takedensis TaxID=259390 RepID=UPI003F7671B7
MNTIRENLSPTTAPEGDTPQRRTRFDTRTAIALTLLMTDYGRHFVTNKKAEQRNRRQRNAERPTLIESTPAKVRAVAFDGSHEAAELIAAAEELAATDPAIIDAVLSSAARFSAGTQFEKSVRDAAGSEFVHPHTIGAAASLVAIYAQDMANRVKTAPGHLGTIGGKIHDIEATVIHSSVHNGYKGQKQTLLKFRDHATNRVLIWTTTSDVEREVGQRVRIRRAKVTDHIRYKGQDQTVIRYLRFED